MFHPDSTLQWLNTLTGDSVTESLSNFIMRHLMKLSAQTPSVQLYDFHNANIMLRDLDGWTALKKIKLSREQFEWCKLTVSGEEIILSTDTLVPTYDDIENPTVGFHGSRVYSYTLKNPECIYPSDYLRLIRSDNGFRCMDSIGKCTYSSIDSFDIVTESRFVNINGMYMFADDKILVEEAKKMAE